VRASGVLVGLFFSFFIVSTDNLEDLEALRAVELFPSSCVLGPPGRVEEGRGVLGSFVLGQRIELLHAEDGEVEGTSGTGVPVVGDVVSSLHVALIEQLDEAVGVCTEQRVGHHAVSLDAELLNFLDGISEVVVHDRAGLVHGRECIRVLSLFTAGFDIVLAALAVAHDNFSEVSALLFTVLLQSSLTLLLGLGTAENALVAKEANQLGLFHLLSASLAASGVAHDHLALVGGEEALAGLDQLVGGHVPLGLLLTAGESGHGLS